MGKIVFFILIGIWSFYSIMGSVLYIAKEIDYDELNEFVKLWWWSIIGCIVFALIVLMVEYWNYGL